MSVHKEENAFCQWWVEEDTKALVCVWKSGTADMTLDDLKAQALKFADSIESKQLRALCSDNRQFMFPDVFDMAAWHAENVLPRFRKANLRAAYVVPDGMIEYVPKGEQKIEEGGYTLTRKFFEGYEEAYAWATKAA